MFCYHASKIGVLMAISAASLGLFSSSSSTTSSITPIDLSSAYAAKYSTETVSSPKKTIQKMAPWDSNAPKTASDKLASTVLSASSLFAGGLGNGVGSGVSAKNDKELFLLHTGVEKLKALAEIASSKTISDIDRARFQKRLDKGLAELKTRIATNGLDGAQLLAGKKYSSMSSDALGKTGSNTYTTAPLVNGDENTIPPQFAGNISFDIEIKDQIGGIKSVNINLNDMGATARTVSNVSAFINSKLDAAGVLSRIGRVETTKAATIKGMEPTLEQRLKIYTGDGETLSFKAIAGDTENAIYVAGVKTVGDNEQGLISRIDIAANFQAETISRNDVSAINGGANIRAMTRDADGNIYIIANSDGELNGFKPKSETDVILQKLDSTGNVVFSRSLGSAADAKGFSIAVDIGGTIAIAGAVDGKLDNSASISGNKTDSFIATFDENGKDLWQFQQGGIGNDEIKDIAFDGAGNLIVLGKTESQMGDSIANGGIDAFVQSFDGNGGLLYSKSLGTTGNDVPVSIEINGTQALVAWNDGANAGHISKLNTSDLSFAGADILVNDKNIGRIKDFVIDDNGNAIISGENPAIIGMNDQLVSFNMNTGTVNFSKNFAGNPINSINFGAGLVNVALEGVKDEAASDKEVNQTLLKGFSALDGSEKFALNVQGEAAGNIEIVSTYGQSKSLQALGLPQGEMLFGDTQSLTDLTGLHAGDYFYVAANNGAKRKITIAQDETMTSLATKISNYMTRYATVSALTKDGAKYLSITPKGTNKIDIIQGSGAQDALEQLGLDFGTAISASATKTDTKTGKKINPIIALEIPETLNLSDKTTSKTAMDALDGVMRRIRMGYRDVSDDPTQVALRKATLTSGAGNKTNSAAIASYNAQTAAMQNALAKLGG